MPDLSNLLGAVYGDSPTSTPRDPEDEAHVEHEPAAEDRGPAVPDWADDDHLDAAFAQWKPGPSDDASPAEHAFVKETDDDDLPPPLPDDLAAALSEALVASSGTVRDTDIDVADADAYGGPKPKAYDFSLVEDDVEPIAEVQPVHQVDEAEEPEAVAQIEAPEPVAQVDAPVEEPEVPEVDAASNLHAVPEVSEVDDVEEDDEDEDETEEAETDERAEHAAPVEESDDHLLRRMPSLTPQREAAAELTAANRPEAESAFAPPSPEPAAQPEPAPVASTQTVPVAAAPAPIATLPAGARRWDRSEDDILPEKQSKKFFSFSLRRG